MNQLPGNTASAQQAFAGSPVSHNPGIQLEAGSISCYYENGWLHYLSLGQEELVRKVYSTLRDENWLTVPLQVYNEKIRQEKKSFYITYDCTYLLRDIYYQASVTIRGTADNEISYVFEGEACSSFLKNRVGICVHLPISSCAGTEATIEHSYGHPEKITLPVNIHPYQPALDIRSISWITRAQTSVALNLDGEKFEMEDQRNWTDASFKIYSTPLSDPFPVLVKRGDKLRQSVVIQVKDFIIHDRMPAPHITVSIGGERAAFPAIGYSKAIPETRLTRKEINLLEKIPFDHYRVDLRMDEAWYPNYAEALEVCEKTAAKLELVISFSTQYKKEAVALTSIMDKSHAKIHSILLLQAGTDFTPLWLAEDVMPLMAARLPGTRLGIGTDFHFAEWNRNFHPIKGADFTSYSVNPQMHGQDYATLIENLAAQADTVFTAKGRIGSLPLFISPVTLKPRYTHGFSGNNHSQRTDERQGSLFIAGWACLSLKYLAKAQKVTLFELTGAGGIMPDQSVASPVMVYPVYLILQELHSFMPAWLLDTVSDKPLKADAVTFMNAKKELLCILTNFTGAKQHIHFDFPFTNTRIYRLKTLTADNIGPFLSNPSAFSGTGYGLLAGPDESVVQLLPYSIYFLKII